MEQSSFQQKLIEKTAAAEQVIAAYLPKEEGVQKLIFEAMNYSVRAGGKRLRPILLSEACVAFGGDLEDAKPFMAAMEMIHTYSLVHDDLPAMDNDEYRRGRETTWKVYGDAMGVLAGDALLNYAFETVLCAYEKAEPVKLARAFRALSVLANKAGVYGMIGGQTVDVLSEGEEKITPETLLFIHENKTAALLEAALMIGAILAGAAEETIQALTKVGSLVGLAFQIQDDILDVTSTTQELGKPVGSDEKNKKQTYVSIYGLDASRQEVKRLTDEAVTLLREHTDRGEFLEALLVSLVDRRK